MAWLDHMNERDARRLARSLKRNALETRDAAQEHLAEFAHKAGDIAGRTARELADYGRHEAAETARETAQHYAQRANEIAHQIADYSKQEGALIAREAVKRALRTGRAVKSDPVPVLVGAFGIAMFATLILNRRSRRDRDATLN